MKNYYSFGMAMPGRSLSLSNYRFGFNGKEKDDDVKGFGNSLDFEARIYDSRLGRYLSIDPLFNKYPFISPYHGLGNNPNIIIDKDGRENIIYLVSLPNSNPKEEKVDANEVAAQANKNFAAMGLKTTVVVKAQDFNPKFMDATDAVAILGNKKDVIEYVSSKIDPAFGKEMDERWKNDNSVPEYSQNDDGPAGGKVIGIDNNALRKAAQITKSSKAEVAGFLLSHGAGHNANMNHNFLGGDIMKDGGVIGALLNPGEFFNTEDHGYTKFNPNENFQKLQDFTTKQGNPTYEAGMKKRFSNNNPNDNYSKNENQSNENTSKKCEMKDSFE